MTAIRSGPSTLELDRAAECLVLAQRGRRRSLTLVPRRRRDGLLVRIRHRTLDRRLAAGESSEHDRLLAVRAAQLVTRGSRERLARRWDELAGRVAVPALVDPVADALRADRFVLAQGVALAATLLDTAAAAGRRLHNGGEDVLAAVVRAAVTAMDRPVAATR